MTGKMISYCKKYEIPIPKDEYVFKLGTYKAAACCTDLPMKTILKAHKKIAELRKEHLNENH